MKKALVILIMAVATITMISCEKEETPKFPEPGEFIESVIGNWEVVNYSHDAAFGTIDLNPASIKDVYSFDAHNGSHFYRVSYGTGSLTQTLADEQVVSKAFKWHVEQDRLLIEWYVEEEDNEDVSARDNIDMYTSMGLFQQDTDSGLYNELRLFLLLNETLKPHGDHINAVLERI